MNIYIFLLKRKWFCTFWCEMQVSIFKNGPIIPNTRSKFELWESIDLWPKYSFQTSYSNNTICKKLDFHLHWHLRYCEYKFGLQTDTHTNTHTRTDRHTRKSFGIFFSKISIQQDIIQRLKHVKFWENNSEELVYYM